MRGLGGVGEIAGKIMNQVLPEVSKQYYGLIQVLPYMQKNTKHITNKNILQAMIKIINYLLIL